MFQSALDINIEAEAILSSINSHRSGSNPEVECVNEIWVVSRDSSILCYSYRSLNSGLNTKGVSKAQLPRKTRKMTVGRHLGSSGLDPKNNPDSILSQEDLNNIVSKYGFPPNIEVRLPCPGEKADSFDKNWTRFYVVPFHLGLRFPISDSLRGLLICCVLVPA